MALIQRQVDLTRFNTFGIAAKCEYFTEIKTLDDFFSLLKEPLYKSLPRLIIGGGSNILFTRDFPGLVIKNSLKGKRIINATDDHAWVYAAAGEVWHDLVIWTMANNLGGLENLSLIPGCVGASPMQNIGAYGAEIKDVFHELEAYSLEDGVEKKFTAAECRFGYRESVFKNVYRDKYLISSVTFRLNKKPVLNTGYGAIGQELEKMKVKGPTIQDVSNAVINIRRSKLPDPAVTGNAGSFFKNPEISGELHESLKSRFPDLVSYPLPDGRFKLAAGWLIEQCGLKGFEYQGAAVHDKQALVLVNKHHCTGHAVYGLSEIVKDKVHAKFGVELEREVNII
jgi:UDP-N-acetylmuramate dehydrogenase